MHGPHLTKRGDAFLFQIRLPRDLDPLTLSSPIRVNLGCLPRRAAQRAARLLGAAASLAFERARSEAMGKPKGKQDHRRMIAEHLGRDLDAMRPLLAGLGAADEAAPWEPSFAPRMVEAGRS